MHNNSSLLIAYMGATYETFFVRSAVRYFYFVNIGSIVRKIEYFRMLSFVLGRLIVDQQYTINVIMHFHTIDRLNKFVVTISPAMPYCSDPSPLNVM